MPAIRSRQKAISAALAGWQRDLAVRHLLGRLTDDFPVAELASCCGLSRSHFTRAFKVSMGISPHRWLVHERVRRAGELLERTDDSIAQIALSCGFCDQSHLTRIFRAVIGTSPAAWRRQRRAGVAPALGLPSAQSREGRP